MTRSAWPQNLCRVALAALFAAALSATAAGEALAEDGPRPAAAGTAQQAPGTSAVAPMLPPQPPPANGPGFLHRMKVWWNDSTALFAAKFRDTRGVVDKLNQKSSDAAKSPPAVSSGQT